jgi:hypothetical protein
MPVPSRKQTVKRDVGTAVAIAALCALLSGAAPFQGRPPDPWLVKSDTLKVRVYSDPGKRFIIEYPAKDWTAYPGGISSLVSFHQKKGLASVIVELETLDVVAEQRFVNDLFLSLRAEDIHKAEPQASAIEQRVIDAGEFRIAVLVYSRPGVAGQDSLRVYHMLRGRILYRIVCRAAQGQMPAFDAIFAHFAASFTAPVVT